VDFGDIAHFQVPLLNFESLEDQVGAGVASGGSGRGSSRRGVRGSGRRGSAASALSEKAGGKRHTEGADAEKHLKVIASWVSTKKPSFLGLGFFVY
jgi:hypothetical protein